MLATLKNKKIYVASEYVDFRLGLNGLAEIVMNDQKTHLHDGAIYVFYNREKNKIKCLTWDTNGLVLYYKRLDNLKFKLKFLSQKTETITYDELELLLAGMNPTEANRNLQLA